MKSLLTIFLLGLALAGCTTLTAPVPATLPSDLTSYFWPNKDTSFNYIASTGSGHAITLTSGGAIYDKDLGTDSTVLLNVSLGNAQVNISGLSAADLLGLDASLSIVSDTAPNFGSNPLALSSIASIGKTLYASSGNNIYQYYPHGDSLHAVWQAPFSGIRLIAGRASNLYAFQIGGNGIAIKQKGANWTASVPAPGNINCFTPGDEFGHDHVHFWIATGPRLYRYSQSGWAPVGFVFSAPITAMDEVFDDDNLLVGLSNGALFNVHSDGHRDSLGMLPPPITAIENGFVGTSNGLFTFYGPSLTPVRNGAITALLGSGGGGVFAGLSNDSVFWYFNNAQIDFGTPASVPVSQFSDTGLTPPLFALAGSQLYEHQKDNSWVLRGQGTPTASKWTPGTFTMLKDVPDWRAAYVEDFSSNDIRGYAYWASVVLGTQGSANIQLDGLAYNDVIAVQYTPMINGVVENISAPTYLIYYQRGRGPIRIERTEAGVKTITRLVQ
ncbi:MAG: hypothetical protein Q8922_10860 [Bacteroidota bacterium]|nr:hypothetical protein [Bacteroidota bacterium]MDP4232654.1 hypothetical protein [Bacteroidota bacterium]MDP4243906.1 hypothetical protein [Bacteroidota bacterium]MDP4288425.1 hypothetical protein [Bacteroidota bacterium]